MIKLNKKGFTLVELLAVIVILALLMVVAASAVGTAQENAKKSGLSTEAKKIYNGISNEATALALVNGLNLDAIKKTYPGTDTKDFTYDVAIDEEDGKVLTFIICYQSKYYVELNPDDGTFSEAKDQTNDKKCTGNVTLTTKTES